MHPSGGLNRKANVMMTTIQDDDGRIRPMGRHDLSLVGGMMAVETRAGGGAPPLEPALLESDLFGAAPGLHGLVVERFDLVVGYALLNRPQGDAAPSDMARLRHLFIQPGSRGRGLGRLLVEGAAVWAAEAQCPALIADMTGREGRARAFCAACGFAMRGDEGVRAIMWPAEGQAA